MSRARAPPNSTEVSRFTCQETESGPKSPASAGPVIEPSPIGLHSRRRSSKRVASPARPRSGSPMGLEELPDRLARVEIPLRLADDPSRRVLDAAGPGVPPADHGVEDHLGTAEGSSVRDPSDAHPIVHRQREPDRADGVSGTSDELRPR